MNDRNRRKVAARVAHSRCDLLARSSPHRLEALEPRKLLSVANGSFEQGLDHWTPDLSPFYGDAFHRDVHWASTLDGSYREYRPKHGFLFAMLTATGDPGSEAKLSQSVTVNAGDRISGWALFDTADFASSADSDGGYVAIRSAGGQTIAEPFKATVRDVGNYGETHWTEWQHTFTAPGTYTVEARVRNANFWGESHLGLDAVSINGALVVPPNQPPVLDPFGPFSFFEGEQLFLSANASDPDFDWLDYRWDLDNDGAFDDGAGQWLPLDWLNAQNFGFTDGPSDHTVRVRVSDGPNVVTGTATVRLENSPPNYPGITGPTSAKTGQQVSFTASTGDPAGAADPLDIDWTVIRTSDNSVVQSGSGRAFRFDAPAVGSYTISVHVTDGDSDPLTNSVSFSVLPDVNHEPFFTNGSPYANGPVEEGWSANISGTFDDIDQADVHTVTVDWGDGTIDQVYPTSPPFQAARVNPANGHIYYLLGPMPWQEAQNNAVALGVDLVTINDKDENDWVWNTFGQGTGGWGAGVIWLGLTDDEAYSTEGNFVWTSGQPVTYTNWFSGEPNDNNNEDYTAMWNNFGGRWNDFRASDFIGWGGYAVLEVEQPLPIPGREFSVNHLYRDDSGPGAYAATVTIDDGDGGVVSQSVEIGVYNAQPYIPLGFDYYGAEGQPISFASQIWEPGRDDDWTVFVDFGDGTTKTFTGTGPQQLDLSHAYADEGFYIVNIHAADEDGGMFDAQVYAVVDNAAPRLSGVSIAPAAVLEKQSASLSGLLSDGGTSDSHDLFIDWGDGSTQTVHFDAGEQGVFEVPHTYSTIGTYSVTYYVTDNDGGSYFPPAELPAGAVQWEAAAGGNGHWYAIVSAGYDWRAAKAYAEGIGGQLLSINSAAEQAFLNNHLLINGNEWQSYWMGLTDEAQEGNWLWVDGTPLTYPNWNLATGEPNDFNNEDYGILNFHYSKQGGQVIGTWNDEQRIDTHGNTFMAVVEFTQPPTWPTVTVSNAPPVVSAGDDAAIHEGGTFTGTGSFTDASPTDTWTAKVDYGDGSGWQDLTLSADKTFSLAHAYADDGRYTVQVVVTDGKGGEGVDELVVTVKNVAPIITSLSGPVSGVRGQTRVFTATFTDPGLLDSHTTSWVVRDAQSNLVAQGDGPSLTFTPTDAGFHTVEFTVTDDDGGTDTASTALEVKAFELQAAPADPFETVLAVGGSTGADNVHVVATAVSGVYELLIGGVSQGTFSPTAGLLVFAQAGDDRVQVDGSFALPVTIHGGEGNDWLKAGNGGGVLLGGSGDDQLIGGAGRDLLIGGGGRDQLLGGGGDDILIAGTTAYDAEDEALTRIFAEWSGAGTFGERVARLSAGVGPDGARALNTGTVLDDTDPDLLTGGAGGDWFVFRNDGQNRATDVTAADAALHLA